jgi:hypothetical protein
MPESLDCVQQQGFAGIRGKACHMVLCAARQFGIGLTKRGPGAGPDKVKGAK